jgi:hypothetical protein
MKTVRLLKDRGGDKKGGRITVPDDVAAELVKSGTATADLGGPAVESVAPAPVAPTVPKAEYDTLLAEHESLKAVSKEFEAEAVELEADNKKLAEEVKGLKAELAKKAAPEKKP